LLNGSKHSLTFENCLLYCYIYRKLSPLTESHRKKKDLVIVTSWVESPHVHLVQEICQRQVFCCFHFCLKCISIWNSICCFINFGYYS